MNADPDDIVVDVGELPDGPHVTFGPGEPIDLSRLAAAQPHYLHHGYELLDAPWVVPGRVAAVTLPATARLWDASGGGLVGSAEQGFLAALPDIVGRGQAFGPCFRWGDDDGGLHRPCFLKVELIDTSEPNTAGLDAMIEAAVAFFRRYLEVNVERVDAGFDIVTTTGVELGSYGIRSAMAGSRQHRWVYGTGCAEPRLSYALRHHR